MRVLLTALFFFLSSSSSFASLEQTETDLKIKSLFPSESPGQLVASIEKLLKELKPNSTINDQTFTIILDAFHPLQTQYKETLREDLRLCFCRLICAFSKESEDRQTQTLKLFNGNRFIKPLLLSTSESIREEALAMNEVFSGCLLEMMRKPNNSF